MAPKLLKWIFKNDKAYFGTRLAFESLFPGLFLLMAILMRGKIQDIAASLRILLFAALTAVLLADYYLSFKRYRKSDLHVSLILLRFAFWERLSVFYLYNCIRILGCSLGISLCIDGFLTIWGLILVFLLSVCTQILLPLGFEEVLKKLENRRESPYQIAPVIFKNRFISILYVSIYANEDRISMMIGLIFAVVASVQLNVMKLPFVFVNYITSWIVTNILFDMAVADEDMYVLNVLLRKNRRDLRKEKTIVCMALIAFFTILNLILHFIYTDSMCLTISDILWSLGWIGVFWYLIQGETLLLYEVYPNIRVHRGRCLFISLTYFVPFFNLLFCTFIFAKEIINYVYDKSDQ